MKHSLKNILLFGGGFTSGVIVGYHLYELRKEKRIDELKREVVRYAEEVRTFQKALRVRSAALFNRLSLQLRDELAHPVPDLYKATEGLSLDPDDIAFDV